MARSRQKRTAFQDEGHRIFHAERAAKRLLERIQTERSVVLSISRDELAALAQQTIAVAHIASAYHVERAAAGSLTQLPEPVV